MACLAVLREANVRGVLAEAAAADVKAVLADDTATVVAHAAAAGTGRVLLRVGVVRVGHGVTEEGGRRHRLSKRYVHVTEGSNCSAPR